MLETFFNSPVEKIIIQPDWYADTSKDIVWQAVESAREEKGFRDRGYTVLDQEVAREVTRRIVWQQMDTGASGKYGKGSKAKRAERTANYERAQYEGQSAGRSRTQAGRFVTRGLTMAQSRPVGASPDWDPAFWQPSSSRASSSESSVWPQQQAPQP